MNYSRWSRLAFAASLVLCVLLASRTASPAPSLTFAVTIQSASIDYSTNEITLRGAGFDPAGRAPAVSFNGTRLTLISFAATSLVAKLPAGTSAATYELVVTNSVGLSALFDVSYGAVGPQGPAGAQGPIGPAGAPGTVGPAGPGGATGATGSQGSQGAAGPAGTIGATGATGNTGAAGPAGAAGATGLQGSQGIAGPLGPTGAMGATGSAGPAGSQGPAGLIGAIGPTGSAGPQGQTGATGATGLAGPTGSAGGIGPAGPVGATGAQGSTGVTGPAGSSGLRGATGAPGIQGEAGPTGVVGVQGSTGPVGETGAPGPTGPQGLQGTPGIPGQWYYTSAGSGPLVPGASAVISNPLLPVNAGGNTYYRLEANVILKVTTATSSTVQCGFSDSTAGSVIVGSLMTGTIPNGTLFNGSYGWITMTVNAFDIPASGVAPNIVFYCSSSDTTSATWIDGGMVSYESMTGTLLNATYP